MKLYKHQQDSLDMTKELNRVAYYLDMGLGKTYVGSEKMLDLGSQVNLLICQKSKINDWFEHFVELYGDKFITYDLTDKNQMELFNRIPDDLPSNFKVLGIINYELAFRRKILSSLTDFTLMLDESSMIQNETAKRSKFVLKLNPKNVILLSGTPTSGKYENLFSQLKLLGWKISKDLFWKQYVDTEWVENGDFFRKSIIGYKNVERLKKKLHDHGAIFMKSEEVFDLPDQIFNKVLVGSSKEYRKFMKNKILIFDTLNLIEFKDDSDFHGKDVTSRVELVGDMTLTKRLYARMLCGQYSQNKLDAFSDLLESTNDRLIVFYNFNEELAALTKIAAERPISIINGSIKDLAAYDQHNDSITFVQYQAGAMGLNLQKANKIIYFTLPLSSEHFEQSKKRIHRIGQDKHCFYYLMMVAGSVEEDVLSTLEMRKDYTDVLFESFERKENK